MKAPRPAFHPHSVIALPHEADALDVPSCSAKHACPENSHRATLSTHSKLAVHNERRLQLVVAALHNYTPACLQGHGDGGEEAHLRGHENCVARVDRVAGPPLLWGYLLHLREHRSEVHNKCAPHSQGEQVQSWQPSKPAATDDFGNGKYGEASFEATVGSVRN